MRFVSMENWAFAIAVTLPLLPAIVAAKFLRSWTLFVAALVGILVGPYVFSPLISATFDDPFDALISHLKLDLQGTLPGAVIGLFIGVLLNRLTAKPGAEKKPDLFEEAGPRS